MKLFTIRQTCEEINRSDSFVRTAVRIGRIKADKVGNQWVIDVTEIRRFKKAPFQLSAGEYQ